MRTEEERMEQIRKRTVEIRKKERKRSQHILEAGCIAVCMVIIICVGIAMPQLSSQLQYTQMDGLSFGAASILGNNGAQGYIFIGILSFVLGVCVTVLMYRMYHKTREKDSDEF